MQKNQTIRAAAGCKGKAFKTICLTALTSLFLFNSLYAQNQQRRWFQNSKDIDFTANPPEVAVTSGVTYQNGTTQKATNGVHDHNNAWIFNTNGNFLYAPGYTGGAPFFMYGSPGFDVMGTEVGIVPVPGSCDSFYLFYSHKFEHQGNGCTEYNLSYYIVDRNWLDPQTNPDLDYSMVESGDVFSHSLGGSLCPTPAAIAISKEKLLNGAKTRQLFYTETDGSKFSIKRVDITYSGGILSPVTLYTHTDGVDLSTYELELSPDGSMLALGRCRFNIPFPETHYDKDIVLYHLNSNGTLNTSLGTGGVTYIDIPHGTNYQEAVIGLEFSPNSQRLFASVANDAIWYIENFTTTPTTTQMNPTQTQDFTFSQMEWVHNGGNDYIAVAKNETDMYKISNPNPGIQPPSISAFNFVDNNSNPATSLIPQNHLLLISANGSERAPLCLPD